MMRSAWSAVRSWNRSSAEALTAHGLLLAFCLFSAMGLSAPDAEERTDLLSYPDTDAARRHWAAQQAARPVRVEQAADGSTCLAFDAAYEAGSDRAYWDWTGALDLSQAASISLGMSASNGGLGRTIGIYFGTPGGWYAYSWPGNVHDEWTSRTFVLDDFSPESKPDGWDRITTFRFSVWTRGTGTATYRLRNLRVAAFDPDCNLVQNGSFEIATAGVPYAWGSGHWGLGYVPWAVDPDLWRRHWHLDRTIARHGTTSLCLENVPGLPLLEAYSARVLLPRQVESTTLSAWLRSDQDELPVVLACGDTRQRITVGRDWQQTLLAGVRGRRRRTMVSVAPQAPGKLWIDAVQLRAREGAPPEFQASADDAAVSAREQTVDWSQPRRAPAVAAGRRITGSLQPSAVRIDEHGRFLLDGKPYVPHALGLVPYVQHSTGVTDIYEMPVLGSAAAAGFNSVCIQVRAALTLERLREMFDRCAAIGLRIIPWLDKHLSQAQCTEIVTALRDHPALLCWYVIDEPGGRWFDQARARLKMAKTLDPSRPAFVNYMPYRLENQIGDIYSTDVYPIPDRPPRDAVDAVAHMKAAAEKEQKPVWMWLQGTGYAHEIRREPSPRELSCMLYGSLIAGARGIYYFAQVPRTKECFAEMRALCVEVEALTPALYSLETAPELHCDQSGIMCAAYTLGREIWVLAVNMDEVPREARFSLPRTEANTTVSVMFEGRRLEAAANSWRDTFGCYERHVYRLALD